ncbi:MAG: sensor histidine kinase, partial [Micromonosporaceae bacterium]|nr:sensor histidine kinase [Micromonosporaceae bacterium]
GAPVAVRRLRPVPVFLAVLAASVAATAAGVLLDPFAAASFALYPIAVRATRSWIPAWLSGALAAVVLVAASVAGSPYRWWHRVGLLVLGTGFLAASWTAGRLVRQRRAEAARSAAELASHAVTEERLHIARELHDVVAHSMGLIAIQAGTANHVAAVRPDEARHALRVIETTSRGALAEMRRLLGVLRSEVDGAELEPAPGLSGLPALAERAEQAGVRVELDLRGADLRDPGRPGAERPDAERPGAERPGAERLPEGVGLSVYRIVQEALTNVVRHAAGARCRVSIMVEPGEVRVEVTDDGGTGHSGGGHGHGGPGHGLVGMRERVLVYGGRFEAGPRPEGGYAVAARIPFAR